MSVPTSWSSSATLAGRLLGLKSQSWPEANSESEARYDGSS